MGDLTKCDDLGRMCSCLNLQMGERKTKMESSLGLGDHLRELMREDPLEYLKKVFGGEMIYFDGTGIHFPEQGWFISTEDVSGGKQMVKDRVDLGWEVRAAGVMEDGFFRAWLQKRKKKGE